MKFSTNFAAKLIISKKNINGNVTGAWPDVWNVSLV